ncbi:MAG: hypothetical protein QOI95_62 [Acidimicrobiaceae bacterium]
MLVELGLVEQRYQAVLDASRDGATVSDIARRKGVSLLLDGHVQRPASRPGGAPRGWSHTSNKHQRGQISRPPLGRTVGHQWAEP